MSIQGRADQLGDRIAAVSDRAERAVTARLDARLGELERTLLALWVAVFGSVDGGPDEWPRAARFAEAARLLLVEAMDPALLDRGPLAEAVAAAYTAGVVDATSTAPGLRDMVPVAPAGGLPDLSTAVDEQLGRAALRLTGEQVLDVGYDAVAGALRAARGAVSRVRGTVAHEVTAATARGVREVAAAAGQHVIWVAERDGCLTCLAYAGATALPGAAFPSELTFDRRPMRAHGPILGPPRHPHCQCVLQLWDPSDEAVAEALRREARRSVLRGWANDSEPMSARLQAAARLLERGADMPRSVEDAARRAIRRGRFPEDRPRQ